VTEFGQQQRGEHVVVSVRGRLDMVAAPRLRELLEQTIKEQGSSIVLDFAETTFMDSSGLGAVIGGLKLARQAGGDLRIAAVTGQIQVVLELTNVTKVFRSYATVDEALGAG
jgi:anti-sigma B factor antagonist